MNVAVQIIGWHPRWEKISSIKAIHLAADCGLAEAKRVVERALSDKVAEFEVASVVEAKRVAQELADFGAVVTCDGMVFNSFQDDDGEIPYRKDAVGMVTVEGMIPEGLFSGRLISGVVLEQFDLSVPMNGNLDFRVGAKLISHTNDRITFTIYCEDTVEKRFWEEQLIEIDVDIYKPR